jgi:LysM repeat protein
VSGDTVSEIAEKYGLTVEDLLDANPSLHNHIHTDKYGRIIIIIKPGDALNIPSFTFTGEGDADITPPKEQKKRIGQACLRLS